MPDPFLRAAWQSLRFSGKAVQGLAQAAVARLEQAQEHRGARAARRGMVGPDDPPPPPESTGGILDYRGVARPGELAHSPWNYRLGRPRYPGRRWMLLAKEVGLPDAGIVRHAAVIGPTRSGKTSSIAVPWIYGALCSGRSVVAIDVQGDLWPSLRQYGAAHGTLNVNVFHWNYRDPLRSSSWRWLDDLDGEDAIAAAVEAILGRERPNEPAPSHRRDTRLLTALLTLTRGLPNPSASELLKILADRARLETFLSQFPYGDPVRCLNELLALRPNQYADAVSGMVDGLQPLATPDVRRVTETPGITLGKLVGRPTLLTVGSPSSGADTAEITSSLIVTLAAQRWLRGFGGTPAMLVLDEAPRIQERVPLARILSLGAGVGLAVLLCAQDVSQFAAHERDELLSNCATIVMLPGTGPSSTEYLTRRLGQRPVVELSRNVQRTSPWTAPQRGLSTRSQLVDMIGHREISAPPFDGYPAIVHAATLHPRPILVDLTRADL